MRVTKSVAISSPSSRSNVLPPIAAENEDVGSDDGDDGSVRRVEGSDLGLKVESPRGGRRPKARSLSQRLSLRGRASAPSGNSKQDFDATMGDPNVHYRPRVDEKDADAAHLLKMHAIRFIDPLLELSEREREALRSSPPVQMSDLLPKFLLATDWTMRRKQNVRCF